MNGSDAIHVLVLCVLLSFTQSPNHYEDDMVCYGEIMLWGNDINEFDWAIDTKTFLAYIF